MVFTYHTMAELLALISIAELQSIIVTQTLINPNIVLFQTNYFLKRCQILKYDSFFKAEVKSKSNRTIISPSLNRSFYHGYERI